MKNIIIGISGASASGKSLLAKTIFNELNSEKVGILSEDSYYKDQSHISFQERLKTNYDHPNALEHGLLYEHLQDLKNGNDVAIPQYDYVTHTRKSEKVSFLSKPIVIVEGILLFTDERVRDLIDFKIFVDTPLDICFIRRLERDVKERGRSIENVIDQYRQSVRDMYFSFIEPSKQYADIIVPRGGKNRAAIDILKNQISKLLDKQ